jgi:nitroreductase
MKYDAAVQDIWRHSKGEFGEKPLLPRELVRYATLAPSSHNTQCWKFRIEEAAVSILPDLARRCPAVDPDDHHLFVSLGCAAENLIQAALAHGLMGHARFNAASGNTLHISLESTHAVASTLFQAIPERQTTRGEYDGKPLSRQELELLDKALRTGVWRGLHHGRDTHVYPGATPRRTQRGTHRNVVHAGRHRLGCALQPTRMRSP